MEIKETKAESKSAEDHAHAYTGDVCHGVTVEIYMHLLYIEVNTVQWLQESVTITTVAMSSTASLPTERWRSKSILGYSLSLSVPFITVILVKSILGLVRGSCYVLGKKNP